MAAGTEERKLEKKKSPPRPLIIAGLLAAFVAVLVIQRDFIYGAKGNLGQSTHARF